MYIHFYILSIDFNLICFTSNDHLAYDVNHDIDSELP